MDKFVALDVEIASRSPMRICAIGAVRIEDCREVDAYYSLVRVDGRVRYTHIHGLTSADLIDAPPWPAAWRGVCRLLTNVQAVVAFRALFDRGAILAVSAQYGVRLPRLRFVCAADMIKNKYGHDMTLAASLDQLGLPFPGQPHHALADARAAAAIALACGAPTP